MSFLPSFFVMQTNSSRPYLAVPSNQSSGNLHFVENTFTSPRTKFAIEPSKSGGSLVHIRSCHNNKYWLAQQINGRVVVRASADEPVEDTNNPACTLFRPAGWSPSFSFSVINTRNQFLADLNGLTVSTVAQQFHVTDWETLVILPSQVSFTSEPLNGNFLVSRVIDKHYNYHRFESGMDLGDVRVAHELFPVINGNYRIRNLFFNRYTRNGNMWIWADTTSNDSSLRAIFSFVNLGNGVFALRNLENNRFCGPDSREKKTDCLRAEFQTLTRQTRLLVKERVLERTISDIRYRFEDSRIYSVEAVDVTNAIARNNTNTTDEMTVKFSIEESKTTSWKSSISVTLGVKVSLRVTLIPVILKGKLEASAEVGFTHEWGEVTTRTTKRELTYKVMVPPFSSRRVTLVSRKGSCDVPYSYMQTDLLPDGRRVSVIKDDGIFYGVNSYDFDIESLSVAEDSLGRMYL